MRILPVTPQDVLVELDDLASVIALNDSLARDPLPQILETMPAARTLLLRLHSWVRIDQDFLVEIARRSEEAQTNRKGQAWQVQGPILELPMRYDGPDLADVAAEMGLSIEDLVAAHQATTWRAAFCGFAPGFYYMIADDERFNVSRRSVPRTAVPAGSVALGGPYCGIYPQESPGGWHIIGNTDLVLWDSQRSPASLIQPGQLLRFVKSEASHPAPIRTPDKATTGLHIRSAVMPVLLQDEGRQKVAALGVSRSGALDRRALHLANEMVGNQRELAALEIRLGPTRISTDLPVTLALTGAASEVSIHSPIRGLVSVDVSLPFALDPGEELTIALPRRGVCSYLARRGGFGSAPELGSQSRDTLAHLGPEPLNSGDVVELGDHLPIGAVASSPVTQPALPAAGDVVELEVTLGPRTEWFDEASVRTFLSTEWEVGAALSRVGMRLSGPVLTRAIKGELPSEGVIAGSIQVVGAGLPLVFLADHPVTGGYPVIATLTPAALERISQVPPGAKLRFTAAAPFSHLLEQG